MMKKTLLALTVFLLTPAFVAAQNKTCSECGIVKYNVTHPWQHHTWCPYYRPQSSGSSSSSSMTNYGAYTVANAATSAIGALLADALFGNKQPQKTQESPEQLARQAAYEERCEILAKEYLNQIKRDRDAWSWNYYKMGLKKYKEQLDHAFVYLVNTKTGKYLIPEYNSKLGKSLLKHSKEPIVPLGSAYIRQDMSPENTQGYFQHLLIYNDRVRLLDSSREPINSQLNGYLLAQTFHFYERNLSDQKASWQQYIGAARIISDTLQWIIKEPILDSEIEYESDNKLTDKIFPLDGKPFICIKRSTFPIKHIKGKLCPWRWNLYDLTGKKRVTTFVYSADDNVIRSYGNLISVRMEKEAENGKIIVSHKYFDTNMNPHPVLSNYEKVVSRELPGIGCRFIVGSEKDGYGVIDQDGNTIIPQRYDDINVVLGYWNLYANVSYTRWYRNEAAQYVKKPGEFEKTDHFNARMADKTLQEQYLREVMNNAESRYLVDMVESKDNVKLVLGRYLADAECFPIYSSVAPWNACYLSVPMSEAENFKMTFHKVKDDAMKTVKWCVRNDAPCISQITITTPDGKTYRTGY